MRNCNTYHNSYFTSPASICMTKLKGVRNQQQMYLGKILYV